MKFLPTLLGLFLSATIGFAQNIPASNLFDGTSDTLYLKSIRVKGAGLFSIGVGEAKFEDTTKLRQVDKDFTFTVFYPEHLSDIKMTFEFLEVEPFRYYSAHKPDIKQVTNGLQDRYLGIITGTLNQQKVFLVDQNHNWDFRDDTVRTFENLDFHNPKNLLVYKYLVNRGGEIIRDSSWLNIGNLHDGVWCGNYEHLLSSFIIDQESFQIGVSNTCGGGSSYICPAIAILSVNGIARDTLPKSEILTKGEILHLGKNFYQFHDIYSGCGTIVLTKVKNYEEQVGTQVGLLAPDYSFVTLSGDTLSSSTLKNKRVLFANISGCTSTSYQMYKDMVKATGDRLFIVGIELKVNKELGGNLVDVTNPFNKGFYDTFRKAYSTYDCYLIGPDGRIANKFSVFDWKKYLVK